MVGVITLVATCLITQVACGSGVCSRKRSGHSATGNIMNKTQRRRKVAYPCAICEKAAGVDTILCSGCGLWSHRTCIQMSPEEFQLYSTSEDYFICTRCVEISPGGGFDYDKSLQRSVNS